MSCCWTLLVTALLLGRPATTSYCVARRSLLAADEDSFVLGHRRSCSVGDRLPPPSTTEQILYRVHELGQPGNATSLAGWLLLTAGGSSSGGRSSVRLGAAGSPADRAGSFPWQRAGQTPVEWRFQQKISAALAAPLVSFSRRHNWPKPEKLSGFLRWLLADRRAAVLDALREVGSRPLTGKSGLARATSSAVSSAISRLLTLAAGASRPPRRVPHQASAPVAGRPPSLVKRSAAAARARAMTSLTASAPTALGLAAMAAAVPLTVLSLHLLLGAPAASLMAAAVYGGGRLFRALAPGFSGGPLAAQLEVSVLLGRALEAMTGGVFGVQLLRSMLLSLLKSMAGI